ncbi:hypothetical protein C2845_PM09G13040 [Panicum miliaceum]|uniref:Uncharacterized protein n=1 Tax=Panicum miliaceum TaxID=4540 RepID=A0A3L6S313_PANMI|nr:hypothetical protein C2845_PM09G13040 [Panicum miliaceum]
MTTAAQTCGVGQPNAVAAQRHDDNLGPLTQLNAGLAFLTSGGPATTKATTGCTPVSSSAPDGDDNRDGQDV